MYRAWSVCKESIKGGELLFRCFFCGKRMFTLTRCTVLELGQRPNDRPPTTSSEVTASVWIIQNWTSTEPNWIESVVRWRFTGTQGHCQFSQSIIHLSNMLFNVVPAGAESIWLLSEVVNPEASVLPPIFFLSYLTHSECLLKSCSCEFSRLKGLDQHKYKVGNKYSFIK